MRTIYFICSGLSSPSQSIFIFAIYELALIEVCVLGHGSGEIYVLEDAAYPKRLFHIHPPEPNILDLCADRPEFPKRNRFGITVALASSHLVESAVEFRLGISHLDGHGVA